MKRWITDRSVIWALLLACFTWVVSVLAWRGKSPTWDEGGHLVAGYSYLKTGDFRLYQVNPPLAKEFAALPLLLMKLNFPADRSGHWREGRAISFGKEFLYESGNDPDKIYSWVRIWMGGLGAALVFVVFIWVRQWLSATAALLVCALLAFNPSFLALLPLATTDTAFVLTSVFLAWALTSYLRRPDWARGAGVGLSWGAALATKHTALIYAPIVLAVIVLGWIARGRHRHGKGVGRGFAVFAVVCVEAFMVIWMSYGFTASPVFESRDDRAKLSALVKKVLPGVAGSLEPIVTRAAVDLRVPARPYVVSALDMLGLRPTLTAVDSGYSRLKYLCGKRDPHGFYEFTVFALVAKNPIPFLLALAIGFAFVGKLPREIRAVSLSFILILFAIGTLKKDFAYRYFNFPMLPFLALIAANGLVNLWRKGKLGQAVTGLLLVWVGSVPWFHFPHFLTYFSPLVGGPEKGVACLLASNSDWGQDLPLLAEWQKQTGVGTIEFSYNGTVPPEHYGIDYIRLPGVDATTFEMRPDSARLAEIARQTRPATGIIAISTTCLYNIQGFYPGADYSWLLRYEPMVTLGHTIRVYRVDELPSDVVHSALEKPDPDSAFTSGANEAKEGGS